MASKRCRSIIALISAKLHVIFYPPLIDTFSVREIDIVLYRLAAINVESVVAHFCGVLSSFRHDATRFATTLVRSKPTTLIAITPSHHFHRSPSQMCCLP
jgi:hypothetical protein